MAVKTTKKRGLLPTLAMSALGLCFCSFLAVIILGKWAESDPSVQATGTTRSQTRLTGTAQAISLITKAAMPSETPKPSNMPTLTPSFTPTRTNTPTMTLDPSITPPTATITLTPTKTYTLTPSPTATSTPTNTPTPTNTFTPTVTPTSTNTPTPIPENAGLTDWIEYEGKKIGVRDIAWNSYLGYYRPDQGKIYVSLYIVAINVSDLENSFFESDIYLVDGGGEITSGVIFGEKDPDFSSCTLKPGGSCEGWWTTMIWDKPEVKENLLFRWDPCWLFCSAMEVPINQ